MSKITAYGALTSPRSDDVVPVVDVHDTTMASSGTTKEITLFSLLGFMPVWPSGDTTGVQDAARWNAALTAIGTASGKLKPQPGDYYLKPAAVSAMQVADAQTLTVDGDWLGVTIHAVAGTAGDMLRMYNPTSHGGGVTDNAFSLRSGVRGVIIDGTSANAGSCGLHLGDFMQPQIDVVIKNFSGAGSAGLWLDNTVNWIEEGDIRANLINNATNVLMQVSGGWDSFSYNRFDFSIQAYAGQDGVVLKNGPQVSSGSLRIRGNFQGSGTSISSAVLRLTGASPSGPSAGAHSQVFAVEMSIQVEQNGPTTFKPQTIFIDSNCTFLGGTGVMNFEPGSFAPSNIIPINGDTSFQGFNGFIFGDAHLNPSGTVGTGWTSAGPVLYTQGGIPVFTGQAFPVVEGGDFFALTLTVNTTIEVNWSGGQQPGPQRKTYVITQAASGGPFTVTWPHTGSPTLTSPTVKWAAGTAPTMSTGAGAVDQYDLSTLDGITWIGRAIQNVS